MTTTETQTQSPRPGTIAQALRRVKTLKGRHAELTRRQAGSVCWTGDDKPVFEFQAVRAERKQVSAELIELKAAVARANATTEAEFEGETRTLQGLVFLMAELKSEVAVLEGLSVRRKEFETEKTFGHEYDANLRPVKVAIDVVHHCAFTESQRVAEVDELRQRIDALNDLLERFNHTTRL